jgi:DNA helicase II / ATP-dependent DNA helicase PcrA
LMYGPMRDHSFAGAAPAAVVERGIEGWYGDYLRHIYSNWQERKDDLDSLISFAGRFDSMAELLAQLVLLNSETSDKGVELQEDAVRMTTVHQAKGLEYPVVFILGCSEEMFPLKRAVDEGNVEEERRLFYVAVTRAMDELYVCFPQISSARGSGPIRLSPSRFILEVSSELYERLGFRSTGW